jgi:4-hydroxyphenylpyruvate dioxygenase-like putative hemolysin
MTEHATSEPLLLDDPADEEFPCPATDAVVLAVRDAARAAHRYRATLGMRCTAYAGPETGSPHLRSYVLESGGTRYVLSSALRPVGTAARRIARHLAAHGEGVLEIILRVPDAYGAFDYAVDRGATPVTEPYELTDRHGTVVIAVIGAAGTVRHTLVDRSGYAGPYLPGYVRPPAHLMPSARPLPA